MINYNVKPGDVLGVLAVKYKTTIRTLMKDNPIIPQNQILLPGWKLKIYTPEENAKRQTENAYVTVEKAHEIKEDLETHEHMLKMPKDPIYYKERPVVEGQIGFVKILKPTSLIEIQANGYEKHIRNLEKGELFRVFEHANYKNGFYLIDGERWITNNPEYVRYEAIPSEVLRGKYVLDNQVRTASIGTQAVSNNSEIVDISFMSPNAPKQESPYNGLSSIPLFERPYYKRPILQMKNAKGESTRVELRVLGFSANYSNSIQPSPTNSGWMINVRANNLPTLAINGFLMETQASNEFDDFMQRYHKYLEASRTDDYYAMGISTLFYKQTEYKGVVVSFSYSDREDETLHRKYSLQMLVLKEKSLSYSDIQRLAPVVPRNHVAERDFRSDIASMLVNPVTGKRFTDFF